MAKSIATSTATKSATLTSKLPFAVISIYFAEAPRGPDTEAIIDEDGEVICGEIAGYYQADIFFSATPISPGEEYLDFDNQIYAEVCQVADPLDDGAEAADLAAHEEAHEQCWLEAKDWLRNRKYKETAYFDRGLYNAEPSFGNILLGRK
jgi:hypothetical protein